jgi:hypothetical protein
MKANCVRRREGGDEPHPIGTVAINRALQQLAVFSPRTATIFTSFHPGRPLVQLFPARDEEQRRHRLVLDVMEHPVLPAPLAHHRHRGDGDFISLAQKVQKTGAIIG